MSEYEGLPLKTMNPFSNNKPRLTASERIRNKRDATIYNAEKQKFQESKKYNCTKGGVKFYKNGKIKSMISYKLQKSLARGSILCEDCNDKGLLCKPPDNKDGLGKINMGNNIVSEFWGGGNFEYNSGNFEQRATENTFIISDISGSWVDGGSNSKAIIGPNGSIGPINIPYGYGINFIKIPRNLNGIGVVLDPSDQLFPNNYCDPFRFMNFGHLKTYLILTMAVPVKASPGVIVKSQPDTCDSSLNEVLVNSFLTIQDANGPASVWFTSGQVNSLCCVGTFNLLEPYLLAPQVVSSGSFGLFDVYINLFNVANWDKINTLLNDKYELASDGTSKWNEITDWDIVFKKDDIYTLPFAFVRKIKLIQGTIPPSKNQTLYNSTQQSYMSCLENGTRKINFTKQNTKIPVTNAFCTSPLPVSIIPPTPPTPPTPPLSPPTNLSGTPSPTTAELSVLNFNEPAGANFPTVGAGQEVRYELFLNNQDPNLLPNPPNSIYALWGRQKSSTGAGNPVSETSAPSSAFRNAYSGALPTGKYYFMARTLLVDTTTTPNTIINTSQWVVSPAIDPAPYPDASLNVFNSAAPATGGGKITFPGLTTSPSIGFPQPASLLGVVTVIDYDLQAKEWFRNQSSGALGETTFDNSFILPNTGDTNPIKSWLWTGALDPFDPANAGSIINGTLWWFSVPLYNTPGDPTSGVTSNWQTGTLPPTVSGQPTPLFSYAGENPAPKVAPSFIS